MTAALPDAGARARIERGLDATLFVEAAAGTGKTTQLVRRVVALLRSGRATLDRVVAVTFTEKAAGEMKLRVRGEIERARRDPATGAGEQERLVLALRQLELARINTIHAFCADLLHERPVEAGVDPLFEVANEEEQQRLVDRAFDAWFERALADPPEGVRRVLRRRARGPNASGPRDQLRRAVECLLEHRDFPARWRREPFERDTEIDHLVAEMAEVGALAKHASRADDYLARSLAEIARFADEVRHREAVRPRDHDGLEAELRGVARWRSWRWTGGRGQQYGAGLERAVVRERRDRVKQQLDAFLVRSEADLAPLLQAELAPVIAEYEAAKRRAGVLDFLDLLVRARDLLRDDAAVRRDFQARYTHLFVDEFQDTDPLQAEILLLLASADPDERDWRRVSVSPGKLFVVGDPKQSIYRFRRADVAIYEQVKRQLAASGAEVLQLAASFRGVRAIQQCVNAAFAPRMAGSEDGSQAAYVPLEPVREDAPKQPAVVALPVPRPYRDWGNRAQITSWQIDASLPDAVGAFVDWLVGQSGWTVEDRDGARVPVAPRHVCLLFRRFQSFRDDVTRPYVRALEQRRIPHVLVGGRSFHEREEVLAIRNALAAIEWPDDELRVFATLRGPLFALADDSLLAFRAAHRHLHPLRKLAAGALPDTQREVAEALAVLAELHAGRNHRPLAQTVSQLLAALRAHAGIANWPTGEQALANCLRAVDLARRFERRGAASFRAFAEWMEAQAEEGAAAEAPAVEEGTEGVRIMTVHRAKGLEFPVVILCDPNCRASRDEPTRHVDPARGLWAEAIAGCTPRELRDAHELEARHDREEAVRIAYVAATRARDLLVAPVIGDPRESDEEGWLDVLAPALHPPHERRRQPELALGCPPFGKDSVLERPDAARVGAGASVAPGAHHPERGEHRVVWWDPRALALDAEPTVGLRQQKILEADQGEVKTHAGERAHAAWQAQRAATRAQGAAPSLIARTVTSLAAERSAAASDVPIEVATVAPAPTARPGGKRFGILVHAMLAAVDLHDCPPSALRALAAQQGRLVDATDAERAAATDAVAAALAHPLLQRAAHAAQRGELRRETSVWLRQPDGSLAEGVVDLAFRENGAWTVVDFKTDRELGDQTAVYEAQVRLYAAAVAAATGEPARGVLLRV
ncbi:MAG: ATP-dependent deoxyribonuclease subunit A [Proteobacteria bacterium]|nr:MAG: ATP-dependent deoxyribonuclease subunit A [Pseudomonadota bacterium]